MAPGFLFMVVSLVAAQLALPKKWAFLPLAIAGLHLGNVEILPELTTARLLILLGLARAVSAGHFVVPKFDNWLDRCFYIFCGYALFSTIGHTPDQYIPSPFNARAGMAFNVMGTYLYGRAFFPEISAVWRYATILPLILIPLAILMTLEQRTRRNMYFVVGAAREEAAIREDKVRAQGPFRHPILAGCAGATVLPFTFLLWVRKRYIVAGIGFMACIGVTLASASSGPLAAVAVTLVSLFFWFQRRLLRPFIWSVLTLALVYNLVKGRGPWYLMASLDLVGGSTGWHRAKLIDQGFVYLNEWWLWGTDYTRHWMSSGVRWNPKMVDLTNYYLHLGVIGGLPLTLCLIGSIVTSFRWLTRRIRELRAAAAEDEILLWCTGASLATHAVSFISISYFDQMYIYFYMTLAAIPILTASSPLPIAIKDPLAPTESSVEPEQKQFRYYS